MNDILPERVHSKSPTFTGTKSLVLTFTNNSSTALTIKLGAVAGYEKTGASLTGQNELVLNSDLVQKTYQTIVNKMNNGGSDYIKNYTKYETPNSLAIFNCNG